MDFLFINLLSAKSYEPYDFHGSTILLTTSTRYEYMP